MENASTPCFACNETKYKYPASFTNSLRKHSEAMFTFYSVRCVKICAMSVGKHESKIERKIISVEHTYVQLKQ